MSKEQEKYKHYSIDDFVWDDEFRLWVTSPADRLNSLWDASATTSPLQHQIMDEARQIILALQVKETGIGRHEVNELITKVMNNISSPVEETDLSGTALNRRRNAHFLVSKAFRIAAVFIIALGTGILLYYNYSYRNSLLEINSAFGSTRMVTLPDSSAIVLNSNSGIRFKKHWRKDEPRELWLKGEAFFKVKHLDKDNRITPNERFLVHVNDLTVEVLGTSFDIRDRRGKTQIVLKSGKIRVSFKNKRNPDIIMVPGQIISIDPYADKYITDTTIEVDQFSAWTRQRLLLNNATFTEIIHYLEDNYGKKIVVQDTSLYRRKYQGTIMLDSLDDALFVLSKVLNVNIVKQNSTIFLMPK